MSWPYHPQLLAKPVPCYTSYPTIARFDASVTAGTYQAALDEVPDGTPVSLYIHVPFCKDICAYCACTTGRATRGERLAAYVDALETEIATLATRIGSRLPVARIAFGGGSPNALAPADFYRLATRVLMAFRSDDPLISVALDPRALNHEWAQTLGDLGVTRASLGVQTLAPHVQRAIGRIQPHEMIATAVCQLRAAGITSLNFDLMFGLPGQSTDDVSETIASALHLAPDRVALFGYAHMPHRVPRQRQIDAATLPDAAARFAAASAGHDLLTAAGMVPIGFDHFARPGDPLAIAAAHGRVQRNFSGFTDDPAEVVLGLGASAMSRLPGLIVQNETNNGRYRMRALAGQLPVAQGVRRDADDRLRARLINDLLCGRTADLRGLSFDGHALRPFVDALLCVLDGPTLTIAAAGRPYARAIAACFDRHHHQPPARLSAAI